MAAVRVWGPNLRDQSHGVFHVHSADCRDNRNYGPRGRLGGEGTTRPENFDSIQSLVEDYMGDIMRDHTPPAPWTDFESEFHVLPCVELPHERPTA
jgi:hypothetical protein